MAIGSEAFMDWSILGTYAGSLAMVLILTQLTKEIPIIKKIPTQCWSYILALTVLVPATIVTQGATGKILGLCIFNAAIISVAANGGYQAINKVTTVLTSSTKEEVSTK